MYGLTTTEFNRQRLALANKLFGTEWPRRHKKFLLQDGAMKIGAFWRRDGKSRMIREDALTYAIERLGSVQAIICGSDEQAKVIFIDQIRAMIENTYSSHPRLVDVKHDGNRIQIGTGDDASVIYALSMNTREIDGIKVDRVFIELSTSHYTPMIIQSALSALQYSNGDLMILHTIDDKVPSDVPWIEPQAVTSINKHDLYDVPLVVI